MLNSILRIIDNTLHNNVDKVIVYAKRILPPEDLDGAEECIRELFDPNAGMAVMDNNQSIVDDLVSYLNVILKLHNTQYTEDLHDMILKKFEDIGEEAYRKSLGKG